MGFEMDQSSARESLAGSHCTLVFAAATEYVVERFMKQED